jgi:methyl-accepting chemotaxis protein
MHSNVSSADKPDWFVDAGLTEYVDPTGKHIFLEITKIATEKGEGRLDYEWPKSGKTGDPAAPKISYVKLIPDWGWVIGTGVYVDDVQVSINATLISIVLSIVGIIGLSIFIAVALANSIAKPLGTITAVAGRLSLGDISDNIFMQRKDEIGLLANAFERMIEYQRAASDVADQMAAGDLTAIIQPNS